MGKNYNTCIHEREFHIDAASSGFPESKPWASFFICKNCGNVINFLEKNSLDQIEAQNKSLKIQESHTRIGMRANIISLLMVGIAVATLLYGENLLNIK